jgi:hypothetical protein
LPGGGQADEYALTFDRHRPHRLLIVPPLFEEANRMRRMLVEAMRRIDASGIDCFLPDLPGCNESLQPLAVQTPEDWRDAMAFAAGHFAATHVLGVRGGALVVPDRLPGWRLAPVKGKTILRQMLRARILSSQEAGKDERLADLMETAQAQGIVLSGYELGAEFVRQFQQLEPESVTGLADIGQDMLGGSGLWLRAEPGESRQQSEALAAIVAVGLSA